MEEIFGANLALTVFLPLVITGLLLFILLALINISGQIYGIKRILMKRSEEQKLQTEILKYANPQTSKDLQA